MIANADYDKYLCETASHETNTEPNTFFPKLLNEDIAIFWLRVDAFDKIRNEVREELWNRPNHSLDPFSYHH